MGFYKFLQGVRPIDLLSQIDFEYYIKNDENFMAECFIKINFINTKNQFKFRFYTAYENIILL